MKKLLISLMMLTACAPKTIKVGDCIYNTVSRSFYKVVDQQGRVVYSVLSTDNQTLIAIITNEVNTQNGHTFTVDCRGFDKAVKEAHESK